MTSEHRMTSDLIALWPIAVHIGAAVELRGWASLVARPDKIGIAVGASASLSVVTSLMRRLFRR